MISEEDRTFREIGRKVRAGIKPPELSKPIVCRECGPVWSMPLAADISDSCFWCGNRTAGRPIPRPLVTPEMTETLKELGLLKASAAISQGKKQTGFLSGKYLQDNLK